MEAAPIITVPPREDVTEVPVENVLDWLKEYQVDNKVDLLLFRTNHTCNREFFFDKLLEAKALADGNNDKGK